MNRKGGMSNKTLLTWAVLILIGFGLFKYGDNLFGGQAQSVTGDGVPPAGQTTDGACNPEGCAIANALTFAAIDAYTPSTTYVGTNQIKAGENEFKSSLAAASRCMQIDYWLSNTSIFCERANAEAICGPQTVQTKCIANSTSTLTGYDIDNSRAIAIGTQNITVGAGGSAHYEVKYTPEDKKSVMPFGGIVCNEFEAATWDSAKISGFDTLANAPSTVTVNGKTYAFNKKLTYSPSAVANTYTCYYVPAGFDNTFGKSSSTDQRKFSITAKALSGQNPTADEIKTTIYPLTLRVETDGVLKLEAEYDEATTKAFASAQSFTAGFD